MLKNNVELIGLTSLEELSTNDLDNSILFNDTDLFFIRRKNPSIKYISKMDITFSPDYDLQIYSSNKFLSISGIKRYVITYINDSNKESAITKEYPFMITLKVPSDITNYSLYVIDANIFAIEKRVIKSNIQFLLSYTTSTSIEDDDIDDNIESDTPNEDYIDLDKDDTINTVKEIINVDEEYM